LQLARAPSRDQNVAIVTVEAFDQFHEIFSPCWDSEFDDESECASFFAGEAKNCFTYFPTKPKIVGARHI
jgi:hypothetical protein